MRARVSVHKFSSCDGCQLAFLNAGEALLDLARLVEFRHFAEAGFLDEEAEVDIAFVEGSVSASGDIERIRMIRAKSRYLVSIGACATSGGLQALRGLADVDEWSASVYARPETIDALARASPVADYVKVDLALWGCPVNGRQVLAALRSLLFDVLPPHEHESLCLECKRRQSVCVMVSRGEPCMGPVTATGCGAICPAFGRGCYACYGPSDAVNTRGQTRCLAGLGLAPGDIARRFRFIHNQAPAFAQAADRLQGEES